MTATPSAAAQAADHALFGDAVACELETAVALAPGHPGIDSQRRAEHLLRDIGVAEERRHEDHEDRTPAEDGLRRLEAKVDLLTRLVAGVLAREGGMPAHRHVHLSRRGARIRGLASPATPGPLRLRLQVADWLPELLEFPAALVEAEGDTLWLRFDGLAPGLEAALERLVFRLHRRQVAVTRRLD